MIRGKVAEFFNICGKQGWRIYSLIVSIDIFGNSDKAEKSAAVGKHTNI